MVPLSSTGVGLVAAIASGRPGRASAGLTWSSPQSAASLAFLALAAGPAARSGTGGAGRPRCRFVAGGHGGATLCPDAQRMWGAARARGGASSPGTREHGRGPQERSAGGWCRSTGLVREALSRKAGEVSTEKTSTFHSSSLPPPRRSLVINIIISYL